MIMFYINLSDCVRPFPILRHVYWSESGTPLIFSSSSNCIKTPSIFCGVIIMTGILLRKRNSFNCDLLYFSISNFYIVLPCSEFVPIEKSSYLSYCFKELRVIYLSLETVVTQAWNSHKLLIEFPASDTVTKIIKSEDKFVSTVIAKVCMNQQVNVGFM